MEKHVGKTIYLAGYTIKSTDFTNSTLNVFTHKKDALHYLNRNTVAILGDLSLLHGTLTRAMCIPNKLHDNVDIFLVIPRATVELGSCIIQCIDLAYLQKIVTSIITQNIEEEDVEELIDSVLNLDIQDIENLYVLYGYEIELKYCFNEDAIDEEIIEESKKLFKQLELRQKV